MHPIHHQDAAVVHNGGAHASWRNLLGAPTTASHILQLYDNEEFLAAGVAHFAAEGLRRGEAVVLTGTEPHLALIRHALAGFALDYEAAARDGQLLCARAEEMVPAVLQEGKLDAPRFRGLAEAVIAQARGDARFTGVRWWGEMSHCMRTLGHEGPAMEAEDLADALAKRHGISILCSYECDRFDARQYACMDELCRRHSHVIPAEDYVRHRLAVNRAISEVVGELRGATLQSLLSWKPPGGDLPSSQAVLFWLRDTMPEHFEEVLLRARGAYQGEAA